MATQPTRRQRRDARKVKQQELLRNAGHHINVARDALAELQDGDGNVTTDRLLVAARLNQAMFALDEAICQIPTELVPNPRKLTVFS